MVDVSHTWDHRCKYLRWHSDDEAADCHEAENMGQFCEVKMVMRLRELGQQRTEVQSGALSARAEKTNKDRHPQRLWKEEAQG